MAGFMKSENYDEVKELRSINSRTDYFKVLTGPYFKALENYMYKNVENFIKHVPVPERPALIKALRGAGFYFYENDYKSFESHFCSRFLRICECQLYAKFGGEMAEFINDVLTGVNKITLRSGLKFKVTGRRMSGDMCTSIGNGFTNLMLIMFIVKRKGGEFKGFVEGDDGLFATTVKLSEKDFEELGFTVEIKEIPDPCLGHFCGNLCSDEGEVLKDPRHVFRSFFWTDSCIHAGWGPLDQLLRSKALSLAYELPQCPIIGELARQTLRLTDGLDPRKADRKEWHVCPEDYTGPKGPFRPSDAARRIFEEKFGLSIETQLAAEAAFREWDLDRVAELIPPEKDDLWYTSRYLEVT